MPSAPNSIAAPRPPPPSMRPNGNNPGSNPVSQNQNNSRSFQYVPKKRPVLQDDSDESDETDSDWKNSYSVSNSYIQKKNNIKKQIVKASSRKKNNSKTQEKQQRNPKIRSFNYAKRWLYLQKKQKRFSNQTNQKKKKGQFLFAICVKNHW